MSRKARRLRGARTSDISKVSAAPMTARTPTGRRMRLRLMPSAVRAMISLSMDMRPRPSKTPIEHGHGNGEDQQAGDDAEEKREDLRAGTGVADEEFHEANEFGNEQNEGKNEEAEESVTYNFPNNVAIEDAHDAKRECNMGMQRYG